MTHTFTITNNGTADLTITSVTPPTGFTVTTSPTSPVTSGGGTTTFDLQCDAASVSTFSGTVTIASDASNAPSFSFDVTCVVNGIPSIAVSGNGNAIANNDITPSATDDTDFGTTSVGAPVTHTFTIDNPGTADLTITSVTPPTGFTVTSSPASPVTAGNSTTFDLRCDATSANSFSGTVTIASDASNTPSFTFDVTCLVTGAPTIAVTGSGNLIASGDITPSTTDDTDFGTTTVGTPVTHTFTVNNTGTDNLTISAINVGAGFTITNTPATLITVGNSTTVDVQCDAAAANNYSATVSITSDAANVSVFNFDVACLVNPVGPIISVSGNGSAISAGDTTPDVADDTDFGAALVGTPVTHSFTIGNSGTADLTITSVTPPAGFTVTSSPASPVATGDTTTFDLQCDAASASSFSGTVTINSDAANVSSFDFDVTCLVTGIPVIGVSGSGTAISNGDTTPTVTDDTDFGATTVGTPVIHTFTITNTGTDNLILSALSVPSGFTVTNSPTSPVAIGNSTSFDLQCDAASDASFSGTVSIPNNDSSANPFTFDVTCTATITPVPIINLIGNGTAISSGDTTPSTTDDTDFGTTTAGAPVTHSFTISNSGSADLTFSAPTIPGGFSLTSAPTSPVAASGSTSFDLQCDATTNGSYSGTVSIVNNDASATPFEFDVACVVSTPASATQLAFAQQPTDSIAGSTLVPAVTVQVEDASNALVSGDFTTVITLALDSNPGGSTLSGTLSATVSGGVATFSDLSLNNPGTGYTLRASASGLTDAISDAFNVTAFDANTITGTVFDDLDGSGAQDPGESGMNGVTVFLDLDSSGGWDAGEPSTTTDASGHYAFASLSADTYHVTITAPAGYNPTTPLTVDVTVPQTISTPADFGLQAVVQPTSQPATQAPPAPVIADPLITKSVFPPFAKPGESAVWTITISNPAPVAATGVTVIDDVPSVVQIDAVSATAGTIAFSGQQVTFSIASVASGQTITLTINTHVRSDAAFPFTVTNRASISNNEDPTARIAEATLTGIKTLPQTGEPLADDVRLEVVAVALIVVALGIVGGRAVWTQRRR